MLQCSDNSFYIGLTNNPEERFCAHQDGTYANAYTKTRRPVQLVYLAEFHDVFEVIAWERRIKRWSRKKKEALIARDSGKLHVYSRCMNASHYCLNLLKKKTVHRVMVRLRSP